MGVHTLMPVKLYTHCKYCDAPLLIDEHRRCKPCQIRGEKALEDTLMKSYGYSKKQITKLTGWIKDVVYKIEN